MCNIPTEPGWYWYKALADEDDEAPEWEIVEVEYLGEGYFRGRVMEMPKGWGEGCWFDLRDMVGQWGPKIEPPG